MEVIKKDLKDIVEDLEVIKELAKENAKNIVDNREQIEKNTGALDILHTINDANRRFYSMWSITFISFLVSIGFNIFLLIKLLCR